MELPKRKQLRLSGFDYSTQRAYFITIDTKDHKMILGRITADRGLVLSPLGQCALKHLEAIPSHFPDIRLDQYIVMPNHVHMLLVVGCNGTDAPPNVSRVIQAYKASVSRWYGNPVWQRSFNDHVIRNDYDYQEIWKYIANNPKKWQLKGMEIME